MFFPAQPPFSLSQCKAKLPPQAIPSWFPWVGVVGGGSPGGIREQDPSKPTEPVGSLSFPAWPMLAVRFKIKSLCPHSLIWVCREWGRAWGCR